MGSADNKGSLLRIIVDHVRVDHRNPRLFTNCIIGNGNWLGANLISLLILLKTGIDICIITNYENVSSHWYDPRVTYSELLGKVYNGPANRIFIYFYKYLNLVKKSKGTKDNKLNHYRLLMPCNC